MTGLNVVLVKLMIALETVMKGGYERNSVNLRDEKIMRRFSGAGILFGFSLGLDFKSLIIIPQFSVQGSISNL